MLLFQNEKELKTPLESHGKKCEIQVSQRWATSAGFTSSQCVGTKLVISLTRGDKSIVNPQMSNREACHVSVDPEPMYSRLAVARSDSLHVQVEPPHPSCQKKTHVKTSQGLYFAHFTQVGESSSISPTAWHPHVWLHQHSPQKSHNSICLCCSAPLGRLMVLPRMAGMEGCQHESHVEE